MQNDIALGTHPVAANFAYRGGTIAVAVGKTSGRRLRDAYWERRLQIQLQLEADDALLGEELRAYEAVYGPLWD